MQSCPCGATPAAAACYAALETAACTHQPTDPGRVTIVGQHCAAAGVVLGERGVVLVSRAADGSPVCTGGDHYRAMAQARRDGAPPNKNDAAHFASLSTPMAAAHPHLYWLSTGGSAAIPAGQSLRLTLALVETQDRQLQQQSQ